MAVIGGFAKDALVRLGFPEDKVHVTGEPRFDSIFEKRYDRARLCRDLDIPEKKSIVVLATQPLSMVWNTRDRKEFLEAVVQGVGQFPGLQLVIKLHPVERMEEYRNLLGNTASNGITLCQDVDIHEVVEGCSLLMTTDSTVAVEAMIMGKPILCIDFTGRANTSLYTKSGSALGVLHKEDLVPAIRKALSDPRTMRELELGRKGFLARNVYQPDGQTSKRVAELLVNLIQKSTARCSPANDK